MHYEHEVFWWPYWEHKYVPSIHGLRNAFETSLTKISDGTQEADEYLRSLERTNVPDEVAIDAMDTAGDIHEHFTSVRQSVLSMMCVGLWHLLEQQILELYRQDYLTESERLEVTGDSGAYHKLFTITKFNGCLGQRNANWDLGNLSSWPKLDELCLVANTAKHGFGRSAERLYKIRRDLFEESIGSLSVAYFKLEHDDSKNAEKLKSNGELSLLIGDNDLNEYFNAAEAFWPEFSEMIKPGELRCSVKSVGNPMLPRD